MGAGGGKVPVGWRMPILESDEEWGARSSVYNMEDASARGSDPHMPGDILEH